jgi:hypothetical protein
MQTFIRLPPCLLTKILLFYSFYLSLTTTLPLLPSLLSFMLKRYINVIQNMLLQQNSMKIPTILHTVLFHHFLCDMHLL